MDPRVVSPAERRQKLSPLMKAKAETTTGEKVNACPFGCEDQDLDENGYCNHLIGFTNDGVNYEPMVKGPDGRRRVLVKRAKAGVQQGENGPEDVFAPILEKVQDGDKLVQITISSRVYRSFKKLAKPA